MAKIVIEFSQPYKIWIDTNYKQNQYRKCVEELLKTEFKCEVESIPIVLKFVLKEPSKTRYDEIIYPAYVKEIFHAEFEIDLTEYIIDLGEQLRKACVKDDVDLSTEFCNDEAYSSVCDEINRIVNDIIIATNIVYPGCLEVARGGIWVNDVYYREINSINSFLIFIYDEIQEKKWPEFVDISIFETWTWLTERIKYSSQIGKTPANRAMNAFSYQFNSDNYESIFYALVGIEALYNASSSDGIMKQIKRKAFVLFGEPAEYKKRISAMYEFRSKFIHGKLDFPNKFYMYDADLEYNKFILEEYPKVLRTAQSILIATIRLLIKNNAVAIKSSIVLSYE